MNTELLRRILDDARDNAANPSAAMAIEDLMRDCDDASAALEAQGCDDMQELAGLARRFVTLSEHVSIRPFDVVKDEEGTTKIEMCNDETFDSWLATLERLAQ